jgi:acyl carrier protein
VKSLEEESLMDHMENIRNFIIENFLFGDAEKLEDETSFLDSGIIDSTGILELVAFLEENFDISINDEEMLPENFDSLSNISVYLSGKLDS